MWVGGGRGGVGGSERCQTRHIEHNESTAGGRAGRRARGGRVRVHVWTEHATHIIITAPVLLTPPHSNVVEAPWPTMVPPSRGPTVTVLVIL